jgi:hypothetical protein
MKLLPCVVVKRPTGRPTGFLSGSKEFEEEGDGSKPIVLWSESMGGSECKLHVSSLLELIEKHTQGR